jgi:hypothetical protein
MLEPGLGAGASGRFKNMGLLALGINCLQYR